LKTHESQPSSVLASSRQPLGIEGESLFEVPPLEPGIVDRNGMSTPVRLFVDYAQPIRHQFQPTSADLAKIADICASLDHIPQAIELAAGEMRRSSLDQIARFAQNPLDLALGRGRRSDGSHQQTLRRALDWSYDLIAPQSQEVLNRLSVFSGPFHEEQAMVDEVTVLDCIDELIDASLLIARADGSRRVRILRTDQAFAREKLTASGRLSEIEAPMASFAERVTQMAAAFRGAGHRSHAHRPTGRAHWALCILSLRLPDRCLAPPHPGSARRRRLARSAAPAVARGQPHVPLTRQPRSRAKISRSGSGR